MHVFCPQEQTQPELAQVLELADAERTVEPQESEDGPGDHDQIPGMSRLTSLRVSFCRVAHVSRRFAEWLSSESIQAPAFSCASTGLPVVIARPGPETTSMRLLCCNCVIVE
jgi:hypothetical protein